MNTRDDESRQRWLGLAGAAAVVVIPIALIAATWEPLEPPPRSERPARVEDAATPERTREERRDRKQDDGEARTPRRDRERGDEAVIATPVP